MTCPRCADAPIPVCLSNVLKALYRHDFRPSLEDLRFARDSLNCAIARREAAE